LPMPSGFGFENALVTEFEQGIQGRIHLQVDIPPFAAITAVRPALGDVLLPSKADHARAAMAGV